MKKNRLIVLSIVILGIAVLATIVGTTLRARAASPHSAQPEVVPSPAQQKPIIELIAEQRRINDQKQAEISGAVRMLMSQLPDPITKQTGLDPAKWSPVANGSEGVKFVQVPQSAPSASAPAQPTSEPGK